MKKRNYGLIVAILAAVIIVLAITDAWRLDSERSFQSDDNMSTEAPYIEVAPMEEEIPLVGAAVLEWLNGEEGGEELYAQYSDRGRVYASRSVSLSYSVFNLSEDLTVENNEIELAEDPSYRNSVVYTLGSDKRSIRFDYLFANTRYYYRVRISLSDGAVIEATGSFKTADTPRIFSLDTVRNLRDIGGWETADGKRVKQGLLYRGTEIDGAGYVRYKISASDAAVMTEKLGIRTEMDLRSTNREGMQNVLGDGVARKVYGTLAYGDAFNKEVAPAFKAVFSDLANRDNYPTYVHCTYGKDRTGTICYFLLVLLGVSEEDAYKEWELSVLLDGKIDYEGMGYYLRAFEELPGNTKQEKAENYLLSIGVTPEEIENIREIFLED